MILKIPRRIIPESALPFLIHILEFWWQINSFVAVSLDIHKISLVQGPKFTKRSLYTEDLKLIFNIL
jgi:hypothetical protein